MQQAPDPRILTPDFLGSVCATVTDPCILTPVVYITSKFDCF